MRRYPLTFNLASGGAADGTSAPEVVSFCRDKTVQIGGTFTATVAIQGRLSASDPWITLTTVTAPAIYATTAAVSDLQIVISGWSAGAVTASFAGFNAQQG